MPRPLLSIVVPALNEAANLPLLYEAVSAQFDGPLRHCDLELIIVNDGSTDDTAAVIDEICARDSRVRGLHFARNFGHQYALLAGIEEAAGAAVITMDADLEQPPRYIAEFVRQWEAGAQVVHGVRQDHPKLPRLKKWTSRLFYRVFQYLSRIPMEPGMLDFRLLDRQVVDAVLSMTESDFFLRGIASWVGFRQVRIPYESDLRVHERTRFTYAKMFAFAMRGITSFSVFPLRLATGLGVLMTFSSLLFGAVVAIRHFFHSAPQPGYASTIALISLLMGIQFLLIGMLGEYIARIHIEVKRRPRYIVARRTHAPAHAEPGDRMRRGAILRP
ncbi:MAG: glycosyltransferase family 2 protein [Myxococcales bacterium]|jgi:dolichol-phosphate mannosyltransferase|nr:glycosyltransferase family 2 protein [Myxococcales bacterium]